MTSAKLETSTPSSHLGIGTILNTTPTSSSPSSTDNILNKFDTTTNTTTNSYTFFAHNQESSPTNSNDLNHTNNIVGQAGNIEQMGSASWLIMPKLNSFVDIFSFCCSMAVIFGGLVPYIPQYLKIKRSSSSDGFSTYVCLTLLIANILRIMFWFGHPFELPLLIQSFVIISGMLAMMEICVRVREKSSSYMISSIRLGAGQLQNGRRRRLTLIGFGAHDFWDWDDFLSYVKFLSLFTFIMSLITYLLIDNHLYIETLGYIAVFTESMLGMPQLMRNFAKKSTRGMSVEMVIMWLSGDLFKTLYFFLRKAPSQFYICGSIQVVVDILILSQVLWYRKPDVTYRKLPKST